VKSTQTFGGFGRSNDTFLGVCYFCFFFQPKDSPNSEDVKKQQATYQALLGACPARGWTFRHPGNDFDKAIERFHLLEASKEGAARLPFVASG